MPDKTEQLQNCIATNKTVVIMRHGKVGLYSYKAFIYAVLHTMQQFFKKIFKDSRLRLIESLDQITHKDELLALLDSDSNYHKLSYSKFMKLMLQKTDPTLARKNNCLNMIRIPRDIEVIYHSPTKRARQTAEYIKERLDNKPRVDSSLEKELAEVKFSKNILRKKEFENRDGLRGVRKIILKRWYEGENIETFEDSLLRVKELHKFLCQSKEKSIIIISHGWYLRLLELYFKRRKINFQELKKISPLKYGESFKIQLWEYDSSENNSVLQDMQQQVISAVPVSSLSTNINPHLGE